MSTSGQGPTTTKDGNDGTAVQDEYTFGDFVWAAFLLVLYVFRDELVVLALRGVHMLVRERGGPDLDEHTETDAAAPSAASADRSAAAAASPAPATVLRPAPAAGTRRTPAAVVRQTTGDVLDRLRQRLPGKSTEELRSLLREAGGNLARASVLGGYVAPAVSTVRPPTVVDSTIEERQDWLKRALPSCSPGEAHADCSQAGAKLNFSQALGPRAVA